jgi:hypothetical protein
MQAQALYSAGFFYKVVGVSDPYPDPNGSGLQVQELQLDRPAKADGFAAVYLSGVADVKEKSDGRMPVK